MMEEEALMILGLSAPVDQDELEELYEDKLFEIKQFMLNRMPFSKLNESKLRQFKKIEGAVRLLGLDLPVSKQPKEVMSIVFSEYVEDALIHFQKIRNELKKELMQADSYDGIVLNLNAQLECMKSFAEMWKQDEVEDANVVLSKEPDPMDVLAASRDVSEGNKLTFEQIKDLSEDTVIKREAKRLTLWLNFESN